MIKPLIAALALTAGAATASPMDSRGMDRSVRPGDDFYLYANGTWQRETIVPADEGVARGDSQARKRSIDRLAAIAKEEASKPGSRAGTLYRAYRDTDTVNRLGMRPVTPMITAIMGLPDRGDIAEAMATYATRGVDTLIAGGTYDDDRHPGHNTLWWSSAGLGMGDRGYYQPEGPRGSQGLRAYTAYVTRLLALAGVKDAGRRAEHVVAFERELAAPKPPEAGDVVFAEVSLHDLEQRTPGVAWQRIIHAFGWPAGHRMRIEEPQVWNTRLNVFAHAPLDTLRAYLAARVLDAYAPYLSDEIKNAAFAFNQGFLRGVKAQKPREEMATRLVDELIPDDIERGYASRYFPPESKRRIQQLANHVKAAFGARLAHVTWMDEATRKRALAKLAKIDIEIGYPATWRDYAGLTFQEDDLLGDVINAKAWIWAHRNAQLDKPVDRRAWECLAPSTVNACSDDGRLVLFFPAAYLQPPVFDPAYDAADIYGRVGATIGHELTHQFDPGGATFDENGLRHPWWPTPVRTAFAARTARLKNQYSQYEVAPGLHVDGSRTIGENTADLGGLNIAFDAFRASLGGHELPVVDGLTGDQRFFIAYAESQRAKFSDARLRAQLLNDHAPGHERALEVRNVDAWYDAFHIIPTDKLYIPVQDRVRIW